MFVQLLTRAWTMEFYYKESSKIKLIRSHKRRIRKIVVIRKGVEKLLFYKTLVCFALAVNIFGP